MSSDNEVKTRLSFETNTASLREAKNAYKSLGDDLDNLVRDQERAIKKQNDLAKAMKEQADFEQSVRRQSSETFTSKRNANASAGGNSDFGKIEAGVSALSSLSNGFDVGNIIGATNGLLDFKEGLKSLPSAFSNILSIVNPVTIGLAVITAAFVKFLDDANRQAEQLNKAIDARRSALQFTAEGGTTEEATKRAEAFKRQADAEKQLLTELEAQYRLFEEQSGILSGIAKVISPQEEALTAQIEQSRKAIQDLEGQAKSFETLVKTGATAQNDLNTALEDVPPATNTATDAIKSISDEERALADERRKAEEVARETQRAEEERAKALEALNNRLVDLATKRANDEADLQVQLGDSTSDARRKLNKDLAGLEKEARDEITSLVINGQAEETKSAREHQRDLQKIQTDAQRQREELSANLDFAGLFRLEKDVNSQLSDATGEYDAQRQERQIALDQTLADLKVGIVQERRERQNAYSEELADIRRQADRTRRDRQTTYDREIKEANAQYERMYGATKQGLDRIVKEFDKFGGASGKSGNGVGGGSFGSIRAPSSSIGAPPSSGIGVFNGGGVTNNNIGGASISFQITGNNPQAIGAQVREEMRKVFRVKP